MTHSKSVLITGASGFIGRATVLALENRGWKVVQGSRLKPLENQNSVIHLDLADPKTILALVDGPRYDAIVHAGAHIGWSSSDESAMYLSNVLSTGYLAHLSTKWNAHMVYTSSAIVHGVKAKLIDSDTSIALDTFYSKTKWLGEQLILASNARSCILRIAGVFGHEGPAHLGLNRAIEMAIKGSSPKQVGSGCALRNYIYVKDVAEAICYALDHHLDGVHLLAGSEQLSVCEMLNMLCEVISPSIRPLIESGLEAENQIIKPSLALPKTRSFLESLIDIRNSIQ